jgi:hypothetical protein
MSEDEVMNTTKAGARAATQSNHCVKTSRRPVDEWSAHLNRRRLRILDVQLSETGELTFRSCRASA